MNTLHTLHSVSAKQIIRLMSAMAVVMATIGCSAITDTQLPDGVIGPSTYNNREGAMRLTQAARGGVVKTITDYIVSSGLFTDELMVTGSDVTGSSPAVNRDRRNGDLGNPPHNIRALSRLARDVMGKYVQGETSGWQAQLFIYEAYAEILIADGWCSGVPLSTLDFEGDWTYKRGSTTDEIYTHAIKLLDSAQERAADSVSLQSVIRILKARAQLGLGLYADAKQTVQGIDGEFRYNMRIAFDRGAGQLATDVKYNNFISGASISDNEGINGLPYRSSGDPRTNGTQLTNSSGAKSFFPVKYLTTGDSSTFTLTSGIEAKLILAEAAFHDNDAPQMMTILNSLRTSGTYTIDTTELVGGGEQIDTLWHAGIGSIAGLRLLELPSTPDTQRKLLFSERAAWLFLTGSRQGDLRRLVRKYGINSEDVYPTGVYTVPGYIGIYGTNVSSGLHPEEFKNPLFEGCKYND